jgi:hypothetical protein
MQRIFLHILFLAILFGLLVGCAPNKPGSTEKIGMHFDAVLEFVVEYPLTWQKDRRLPYNSVNGEVRWTHPEHPGVVLKILSSVNDPQEPGKDAAFDKITSEYPRIEFTKVEEQQINETLITCIEGQSEKLAVQTYLLNANNRSYLISLEKPLVSENNYQELMDRVVQSFKAIPKK